MSAPRLIDLTPPSWAGDALCAQTDPELFFPSERGSSAPAKAVCAGCNLREHCLDYAIEHRQRGIWGGMSESERAIEARRRRGGQPAVPRCGTRNGYMAHLRRREQACEPCVIARRDYERQRQRLRPRER